ncbi:MULTISPECIES: LysR family transcriptional regulator [unclassified Cupriavidus]|uniref:LysR family transcriptional regulator n=1 Tax=Cupriavidus sp. H19C3 TaxID=3241603 RepID=UPI003BF8F1D4
MDRLDAMKVFVAVVEAGGFAAASRRLDIPIATISRNVSQLEGHLEASLLVRSTRALRLTDVGSGYYASCKSILRQIGDAERLVAEGHHFVRGDVVVTAPLLFGRLHVLPVVRDFTATFPDIHVRLNLSDKVLNLVDEHIDVAVRVGNLPDSSMIATGVGGVMRVVCGSPSYLDARGRPATPADLGRHDCIEIDTLPSGPTWSFAGSARARADRIRIRPRISVNTAEAAVDAAISGMGLAHVLSHQVAQGVARGELELVLRQYEPPAIPVNLMYASQGSLAARTRAFIDYAVAQLRARLERDEARLQAAG